MGNPAGERAMRAIPSAREGRSPFQNLETYTDNAASGSRAGVPSSRHAEFVDERTLRFKINEYSTYPQGTPVSNRDRDFRPARRRGFDDDNFETSGRSFGSPPGFSAQRFDAPSGSPVQAVVKWYNPEKGFGFVTLRLI